MLRGIGETGLIALIKQLTGAGGDNDVEYVELNGSLYALKVDGLSLATSKLPFMTMGDVGWRSVASVASDFLAKLSKPQYALVSLTLRGDLEIGQFRDLVMGIGEAMGRFGMVYLGGDLNEGLDNVIDVVALGKVMGGIVGRAPRPGDKLVTLPKFGYCGLVFKLHGLGLLGEHMDDEAVRLGVRMLRRPEPPLDMLMDLVELSHCIGASMDSSDGLGKVLWSMAKAGGVEVLIKQLPTTNDLVSTARGLGLDPVELVFNGGEEYVPVFSIAKECLGDFEDMGFVEIGEVVKGPAGVYLGTERLRFRGWDYFVGHVVDEGEE